LEPSILSDSSSLSNIHQKYKHLLRLPADQAFQLQLAEDQLVIQEEEAA
jgi:hypothetical protein